MQGLLYSDVFYEGKKNSTLIFMMFSNDIIKSYNTQWKILFEDKNPGNSFTGR